jgi:hypothetical protein
MDDRRLTAAATRYTHLRGLFAIPTSLVFVLCALGNERWGPVRHTGVFLGVLAALGLVALAIHRYYATTYGRIELTHRQQTRALTTMLILAAALVVISFLLRSRVSWSLDLPVNPMAVSFAVVVAAGYAVSVGLRPYHLVIYGTLLLAGALPMWTGGDPSNVGLILAGGATLISGLLDHRALVQTFGSRHAVDTESDDGEA